MCEVDCERSYDLSVLSLVKLSRHTTAFKYKSITVSGIATLILDWSINTCYY